MAQKILDKITTEVEQILYRIQQQKNEISCSISILFFYRCQGNFKLLKALFDMICFMFHMLFTLQQTREKNIIHIIHKYMFSKLLNIYILKLLKHDMKIMYSHQLLSWNNYVNYLNNNK